MYATTDKQGRFVFEGVPPGRYGVSLLHAVLDSFDLVMPSRFIEVSADRESEILLATPSAATAYVDGCASRLAAVAKKSDMVSYLKISAVCARLARRAARQEASNIEYAAPQSQAQILRPVIVQGSERPISPMLLLGFEERRRLGLGKFVTHDMLTKQQFGSLVDVLRSVTGVHVEAGTVGQPSIYLRGTKEGHCVPTFYLDGVPREMPRPSAALRARAATAGSNIFAENQNQPTALGMAIADLSSIAPPWIIKGIEVYSSPGAIPAQFDMMSSTGCGSIVIWTR